jgi:HK97 family phage portal protein
MSRRKRRDNRPQYAEKADPNIQVVVAQQGVAAPATMPRNMRAYIQEGFRGNKTVFRVVGHIARAGAGIKWKHYTDESKKREVSNSELLQLWNNPSPRVSGTAFREAMIAYYCLTGNNYLLGINANMNPAGKFDELYNLRPDLTKIKVDDNGPLYYEFGNFSPPRRYADPFVLHNKLFAGNDDVYGMSPVEVAAMLVDIQKAGQKWNLGLLSNMARPGGAWVTDALLGDTEYKGLKEEIRKKFAGPRNAGETAILHGGVKWQSMSMSPYELDWLESDTKGDRDIAGIFFNFPLFLLGLADSTYSNQEEARYALYTEIDFPILDMFQDSLNMWLTPRYGGYLGYDQEDVEAIQRRLQEAKAQASDRATAEFIGGTKTFLEAREIQDAPKLPVKDFVMLNQIPVHVEDLDDYIAAMSGKTINPPEPPPQLPPPKTTVTEVVDPDETIPDTQDDQPPPQKSQEVDEMDEIDEISKTLTKYASSFPQVEVTREQYRELLRIKR